MKSKTPDPSFVLIFIGCGNEVENSRSDTNMYTNASLHYVVHFYYIRSKKYIFLES
jgi:hypothetical protein